MQQNAVTKQMAKNGIKKGREKQRKKFDKTRGKWKKGLKK